jgi:hypothetical protein
MRWRMVGDKRGWRIGKRYEMRRLLSNSEYR